MNTFFSWCGQYYSHYFMCIWFGHWWWIAWLVTFDSRMVVNINSGFLLILTHKHRMLMKLANKSELLVEKSNSTANIEPWQRQHNFLSSEPWYKNDKHIICRCCRFLIRTAIWHYRDWVWSIMDGNWTTINTNDQWIDQTNAVCHKFSYDEIES